SGPPTPREAGALVAPVERSAGREPEAVAPTEQKARPVTTPERRPPTRRLEPGDLICGDCGEGNPPIRKFCSRCGTSLAEAEVVRRPWWKRILPRRKAKVHEAGARPGRAGVRRGGSRIGEAAGRIWPILRNSVAVLLLIAGILYSVWPAFRIEVNQRVAAGRAKVEAMVLPQFEPVRPTSVTATLEHPTNPAGAVADSFTNTFWAAPGEGTQPALVFTFAQPVDVGRAILRVGNQQKFQSAHRPQVLHLVFSTGATYDVTVKDTPDPQEVEIKNGAGATSVEIHVQSLYRSLQGTDVAITEIELFRRK
ncbi:MAG TPA: zinc ribbon domain-containing protein, partial [Pseudonocardiaceae bacterium]